MRALVRASERHSSPRFTAPSRPWSLHPWQGAVVEGDVRWWLVKRFPYSVLYRIRDDHVRILAIAHQKRRAFYWRRRR
jgi:hypothetical protein